MAPVKHLAGTPDLRIDAFLAELSTTYRFAGLLGEGGTALVFRAKHLRSGDSVAVKVMHPNLLNEADALTAFVAEAELMETLRHRNIVRVRSVERLSNGGCAIAMDLVDGVTLKQHLRSRGPLPFDMVQAILSDAASALAYAHQRGIAHRDIKPQNIFLDSQRSAALLGDFGIAARIDQHVSSAAPDTMGTPQYMSPEHVDGRPIDQRSDIYSLGCVAYEMLTGVEPWAGLGLSDVLQRQRSDDLPRPSTIRPNVPKALQDLVLRCLQKNPANRWQRAAEVLSALGDLSSLPGSARKFDRGSTQGRGYGAGVLSSRNVAVPKDPAVLSLMGIGVILLAIAVMRISRPGAVEVDPQMPPAPVDVTQMDSSLIDRGGDFPPPEQAREPGPAATTQESALSTPARESAATSARSRDPDAELLISEAVGSSGSGDGFQLIVPMRELASSELVSSALRARLRSLSQDLSRQCEATRSLQTLNGEEAIRCP